MNVVNMLFRYNINPKVACQGIPLKRANMCHLESRKIGSVDFDNFRTRHSPRDALQVGTFGLAVKTPVVAMETRKVGKVSNFWPFWGVNLFGCGVMPAGVRGRSP